MKSHIDKKDKSRTCISKRSRDEVFSALARFVAQGFSVEVVSVGPTTSKSKHLTRLVSMVVVPSSDRGATRSSA